MAIRIGVQVDNAVQITKLNKELKVLETSVNKTGQAFGKSSKQYEAAKLVLDNFGTASEDLIKDLNATSGPMTKIMMTMKQFSTGGLKLGAVTAELVGYRTGLEQVAVASKEVSYATLQWANNHGKASKELTEATGTTFKQVAALEAEKVAADKIGASLNKYIAQLGTMKAMQKSGYAEFTATLLEQGVALEKLDKETTLAAISMTKLSAEEQAALRSSLGLATAKDKLAASTKKMNLELQKAGDVKAAVRALEHANALKKLSAETQKAAIEMSNLSAAEKKAALSAAGLSKENKAVSSSYTAMGSAIRGVSGAMGKLWMTYGQMIPMMAGFAAAASAIDMVGSSIDIDYFARYSESIGKTKQSVKDLSEAVLGIRDVADSPQALAAGLRELAKSGTDLDTAISGGLLQSLSHFATIAEMELPEAIQLTVTQLNAFSRDSMTASDAMNIMSAAALSSPISFQDLAQTLKNTTELAGVAEVSFLDLNTAISLAGQSGLKGSRIGTAIRTSTLKMLDPNDEVMKSFDNAGLDFSAFKDDGTIKKLNEMYEGLYDTLIKLDKESQVWVIKNMFGLRSMKEAQNMLSNITEGWGAKQKELEDAQKGLGMIEEKYAEISQSVKVAGKELGSALKASIISDFQKAITKLGPMIQALTPYATDFADAIKAIGEVAVVGLLGYFATAMPAIIGWFGKATAAAGTFGTAVGAVTSALAVGIIAYEGTSYLVKNFEWAANSAIFMGEAIARAFLVIRNAWDEVALFIKSSVDILRDYMYEAFADMLDGIANALESMGQKTIEVPKIFGGGEVTLGISKEEIARQKESAQGLRDMYKGAEDYNKKLDELNHAQVTQRLELAKTFKSMRETTKNHFENAAAAKKSSTTLTNYNKDLKTGTISLKAEAEAAKSSAEAKKLKEQADKQAAAALKQLIASQEAHNKTIRDLNYQAQLEGMKGIEKLQLELTHDTDEYVKSLLEQKDAQGNALYSQDQAVSMGKEYQATLKKTVMSQENLNQAAKEGTDFMAGFAAQVSETKKELMTMGQFGYEAAEALNQGFKDSASTALIWGVHGLSDAKEEITKSFEDTQAAIVKTRQEAYDELNKSMADGTTSEEEYQKSRLDIETKYNEDIMDARTQYNEDIKKAEEQLGDDLKDIWMGVLDDILAKASDWAVDMIWTLGENVATGMIEGITSGDFGAIGDAFSKAVDGDYVGALKSAFSGDGDCIKVCGMEAGDSIGSAIEKALDIGSDLLADTDLSSLFEAGTGWDAAGEALADGFSSSLDDFDWSSGDVTTFLDSSMFDMGDGLIDWSGAADAAWGSASLDTSSMFSLGDAWSSEVLGTVGELGSAALSFSDSISTGASAWDTASASWMEVGSTFGETVANFDAQSISMWDSAKAGVSEFTSSIKEGAAEFVGGAENLSTITTGLGAAASVYGLYSGISSMANGDYVGGGLKTGMSGYSLYGTGTEMLGEEGLNLFATEAGEQLAAAATEKIATQAATSAVESAASTAAEAAVEKVSTTVATEAIQTASTEAAKVAAEEAAASTAAEEMAGASALGPVGAMVTAMLASVAVWEAFNPEDIYATATFEAASGNSLDLKAGAGSYDDALAILSDPNWLRQQLDTVESSGTQFGNAPQAGQEAAVGVGFSDSIAGIFEALSSDMHELAGASEYSGLAVDGMRESIASLPEKLQDTYTALELQSEMYGDSLATLALQMSASPEAFDAYVDALAGHDVALITSTEMMTAATEAATGNTEAYYGLTESLQAAGVSYEEAVSGASSMMAVMAETTNSYYANGVESATALGESILGVTDYFTQAGYSGQGLQTALDGVSLAMLQSGDNAQQLQAYLMNLGMSESQAAAMAQQLISSTDQYGLAVTNTGAAAQAAVGPVDEFGNAMEGAAGAAAGALGTIDGYMAMAEGALSEVSSYIVDPNGTLSTVNQYAMTGGRITKYASGGVLEGGSGVRDDLYLGTVSGSNIIAQGGEYIMPKAATEKYLPYLEAMRDEKFAKGGSVKSVIDLAPGWTTNYSTDSESELGGLMDDIYDVIYQKWLPDVTYEVGQLNLEYAETVKKLEEAGASMMEMGFAENAHLIELQELTDDYRDSIADLMEPYQILNNQMSDTEEWVYKLTKAYEDATKSAQEMGLGRRALSAIRAAEQQEISNKIADIMEGITDTINESTMSSLDYETWKVNQNYDEMRASLMALGASTSDLTKLEEARRIELEKVSGLDPIDYYKDLIDQGAVVSTFGSGQVFSAQPNIDNQIAVTVQVDGNGIINDGELDSRIVSISDENSYERDRRDFTGQSSYTGI